MTWERWYRQHSETLGYAGIEIEGKTIWIAATEAQRIRLKNILSGKRLKLTAAITHEVQNSPADIRLWNEFINELIGDLEYGQSTTESD